MRLLLSHLVIPFPFSFSVMCEALAAFSFRASIDLSDCIDEVARRGAMRSKASSVPIPPQQEYRGYGSPVLSLGKWVSECV